jgi:hypothetical protein
MPKNCHVVSEPRSLACIREEHTSITVTEISLKFRVFWDVLPCSQVMFTDVSEVRTASIIRVNIYLTTRQGRGVHVTGVSAAYTFKLNKNILSE